MHLARADSLKAVTLFNWATIMNKCIIRYSRGPDGRPDGDYVLLNQNLHTAIQVAVKSCKLFCYAQFAPPSSSRYYP